VSTWVGALLPKVVSIMRFPDAFGLCLALCAAPMWLNLNSCSRSKTTQIRLGQPCSCKKLGTSRVHSSS